MAVFIGLNRLCAYQAHRKTKPAELQRVLCVNLGPEMKLNLLKFVTSKRFL